MERLTSNKNVANMSMLELAYNSCYIDNNFHLRYRDYNLDIDGRRLIKSLIKDFCNEYLSCLSNEEFDEYMASMISVEIDSPIGLIALFYRNLWAMADLREALKKYEDLEEQGRLIKLPCKVGDTVYHIHYLPINNKWVISEDENISIYYIAIAVQEKNFGNTIFLTRAEAEEKIKQLCQGGTNEQ